MQWMNGTLQNMKCSDLGDLSSYATHRMRIIIVKIVEQYASGLARDAVTIFGGLPRRSIYSASRISQNQERIGDKMPIDCFISESCDIDIGFKDESDLTNVRFQLEREFKVTPRDSPGYFDTDSNDNLLMQRLNISPKQHLYGPLINVNVDLVKICTDSSSRCLIPDFDVNQIAVNLQTKELQLTTPRQYKEMQRPLRFRSIISGDSSDFNILLSIHQSIISKNARMIILSPQYFSDNVRSNYDVYIKRLFQVRLPKMLNDDWSITNLLVKTTQEHDLCLKCGCVCNPQDLQLGIEDSFIFHYCKFHTVDTIIFTEFIDRF